MIRCPFCGGPYVQKDNRVACLMCDRSPDIKYELEVQREQRKDHRNWWRTYTKDREIRRKNEVGY